MLPLPCSCHPTFFFHRTFSLSPQSLPSQHFLIPSLFIFTSFVFLVLPLLLHSLICSIIYPPFLFQFPRHLPSLFTSALTNLLPCPLSICFPPPSPPSPLPSSPSSLDIIPTHFFSSFFLRLGRRKRKWGRPQARLSHLSNGSQESCRALQGETSLPRRAVCTPWAGPQVWTIPPQLSRDRLCCRIECQTINII